MVSVYYFIFMPSVISYISSFFARHLRREVKELYVSVAIFDFAVAMVALFEPIYLWKIGFSIFHILLFYLSVYGLYFFILPLGAKIAKGYGFEHSILYSSPFLILYYLSLFAIPYSPLFVGAAVIAFAIQKTLYWPGYYGDFAIYSNDGERGKEVGNLALAASVSAVAGPFIGGMLAHFFGFASLFMIASAAILASNIPLFSTKEIFISKSFVYFKTYKNLIDPNNRKLLFGYLGYGEEFIFMYVWPVFIFLIVKNEFSAGGLTAAAALIMMFVLLYVGKMTDNGGKHSVLKTGVVISAVSWVMRFLPASPLSVFFAETITRIGRNMTQVPIFTGMFDRARRTGHIMESAVFFEMCLILGKILVIVILMAAFLIFPEPWFWPIAFMLAGAMTLLYGLL